MSRFEAFEVALELITALKPLIAKIALHDRDLADQLRRAGSSGPLNINEGSRRVGRDRGHSYRIAAGSAAEVRAGLAVAQAWGYINVQDYQRPYKLADRLLAMLWRLNNPNNKPLDPPSYTNSS